MEKHEILNLLEARVELYNVLRHYFYYGPTAEVLHTFQQLVRLTEQDSSQGLSGEGLSVLIAAFPETTEIPVLAERLNIEFTRLHIGPSTAPVSLYESMYGLSSGMLMGETTIAVRKDYLTTGHINGKLGHIPEDHLAVELDYMFCLSQEILQHVQEDNTEKATSIMEEQRGFLQRHVLNWVPDMVTKIKEDSCESVLTGIGLLTLGWLEEDVETLSELIDSLVR